LEKIPASVHYNKLKRSIVKRSDILLSIAGTIGRVTFVNHELHNSNINQAIAFIRLNDIDKMFNYTINFLKSDMFQNYITSSIVQAVQANISLGIIKSAKFILPNDKVIYQYNLLANSMSNRYLSANIESEKLVNVRDTLLPKLMSGEIEV